MIGNRVRVVLERDHTGCAHLSVEGTLKRVDQAGVYMYVTTGMPEAQGDRFYPMHRVREVIDLGRI